MERILEIPYVKYSIITVGTLLIASLVSWILRLLLSRFLKVSFRRLKVDHTQFNFLKNAVSFFYLHGSHHFYLLYDTCA